MAYEEYKNWYFNQTRDDFFKKFPNARTFPQIIINGEKIGGYHELEKWLAMNSFEENF